MPYFSALSLSRLETCHKILQEIAKDVIEDVDFAIWWGWRGPEAQQAAFDSRHSTLVYPQSLHNHTRQDTTADGTLHEVPESLALDFAPYPYDKPGKEDRGRFGLIAGRFLATAKKLGFKLRWGGDWNANGILSDEKLQDLGHIELVLK